MNKETRNALLIVLATASGAALACRTTDLIIDGLRPVAAATDDSVAKKSAITPTPRAPFSPTSTLSAIFSRRFSTNPDCAPAYGRQPIPDSVSPIKISEGQPTFDSVVASRVANVVNGSNPEYANDQCVQIKYRTAKNYVSNVLGVGSLTIDTGSFTARQDVPDNIVVGGRRLPVSAKVSFEGKGSANGQSVAVREYEVSPDSREFSHQIAVADANPSQIRVNDQDLKSGEKLYLVQIIDQLGNIRWEFLVRDLCGNETAVGQMPPLNPTPRASVTPTTTPETASSPTPTLPRETNTPPKDNTATPPRPPTETPRRSTPPPTNVDILPTFAPTQPRNTPVGGPATATRPSF